MNITDQTTQINKSILDNMAIKMHDRISKNVIYFRKKRGFTQLELAMEIGMSGNAFLARAEKRTKNAHFNIEHLVKISAVLKVDIRNFFEENYEYDFPKFTS